MKHLSMLAALFFARVALAAPSGTEEAPAGPDPKSAEVAVKTKLIGPLAAKEQDQSKFSRARLPAQERRVRVDEKPVIDAKGATFFAFAIDARHGFFPEGSEDGWQKATVTGCVYAGSGDVFVKVGERHRPAAFLLGKNLKPVAEGTCAAAPTTAAAL